MARCSLEQLQGFFATYGWTCQVTSNNACISGWASEAKNFFLKATVNDTVISFSVDLLYYADLLPAKKLSVLKSYLLRLNDHLTLVKLSTNQSTAVVLSVDVLTEGFCYQQLDQILGVLGYYSDLLYRKIGKKIQKLAYQSHLIYLQ